MSRRNGATSTSIQNGETTETTESSGVTGQSEHERIRISYTTLLDEDNGFGALFELYRLLEIAHSDTVERLRLARQDNPLSIQAHQLRIRIITPVLGGMRELIRTPPKIAEMEQGETLDLYLHGIYDLYTKLF